jgi:predicted MPP superfamily phosphohydrolase
VGQVLVDHTLVRVRIPGLHPELDGLRLVQISDLHIGNTLEATRLERMVERTNALDPDVIALTGDLFDFDPSCIDEGAQRLAALRARLGVYAVLGNHDSYAGAEEIASALARLAPDIVLLRDRVARLPLKQPLYLAGVEDPGRHWSARELEMGGLEAVAAERPDDGPTILLVHRPQAFPQAARLGFPLVLAGHTHGGQLALPTPGGRYNLARLVTGFTRGLYRANGSTLYVNRGIGVGGPALRINCPREIATIELVGKE